MEFWVTILIQMMIGIFIIFLWDVNIYKIGVMRFLIGWIVGMSLIHHHKELVDMILK